MFFVVQFCHFHSGQKKVFCWASIPSGPDLADARARFLREAEMSGRLQHPDIVSIIDAGESEGLAYIAMELVEGTDLTNFACVKM